MSEPYRSIDVRMMGITPIFGKQGQNLSYLLRSLLDIHATTLWSKYWSEELYPFMRPPDGSSARARPGACDIARSARASPRQAAETARRCLCPDDFARHGSAGRIR